MRHVLLIVFLAITVFGCSTKCGPSDVVGNYELSAGAAHYELHLFKDGMGELVGNQAMIGPLKWKIEPSTDQVFFEAASNVLDVLVRLSDDRSIPRGVEKTQGGYFGVTPQCRSKNQAERLNLDVDGQRFFLRMK